MAILFLDLQMTKSSSGVCVGIYGLTYSLYHPRGDLLGDWIEPGSNTAVTYLPSADTLSCLHLYRESAYFSIRDISFATLQYGKFSLEVGFSNKQYFTFISNSKQLASPFWGILFHYTLAKAYICVPSLNGTVILTYMMTRKNKLWMTPVLV